MRKRQRWRMAYWQDVCFSPPVSLAPARRRALRLGATRVIYPAGQKQVQLAVTNNDDNSTRLIQSWVENADGQRDGRFVITPPLFAMQGKKRTPCALSTPPITSCRRIGKVCSG